MKCGWRSGRQDSNTDLGNEGAPESVADQLLAFQDQTGAFGTLLYAGQGLERPRVGATIDDPDGRESLAACEWRFAVACHGGEVRSIESATTKLAQRGILPIA